MTLILANLHEFHSGLGLRHQASALPSDLLPAIVPIFVFAAHAAAFGNWIVDDAGISFAYSRNLAAGHGLVAQPGAPPVEGYSNPLWVALMVPFVELGLFHVVWTPKLISLLLVSISFLMLHRILTSHLAVGPWIASVPLLLLALQSSFVIWTVSGLENPLYVLVLVCLLRGCVSLLSGTSWSSATGVWLGVLATAAALVRPEGIVYAAAVPMLLSMMVWWRTFTLKRAGAVLAWYATGFVPPMAIFLAFRVWYFNDLLPNTYYAKVTFESISFISVVMLRPHVVSKLIELMESVAGRPAAWVLLLGIVGTVVGTVATRPAPLLLGTGTFLSLSIAAYLLLPSDWMPEYRFATPFFVFTYVYTLALACMLGGLAGSSPRERQRAITAVGCAMLVGTVVVCTGRSTQFAERPTVPLEHVAQQFAYRFNHFADVLGMRDGAILLPDVGATLLYSRLRVYDLGMLTDRTIARTIRHHPRAFYDYVFDHVRPAFIHTHDFWTRLANLDADERFRRDYVPIHEYVDTNLMRQMGVRMLSGDFVRKDVLRGREDLLEMMRAEILRPQAPR